MYRRLRTDLVKGLSKVKLLLINSDSFTADTSGCGDCKAGINELRKIGVQTVSFSIEGNETGDGNNNLTDEHISREQIENKEFFDNLLEQLNINPSNIALYCYNKKDIEVFREVKMTLTSQDAELDLKKNCYYVSNYSYMGALSEIFNLIKMAKQFPGGISP